MTDMEPSRLISLDAEFADGRYMLELSICDATGKTVYSRRFRPEKIRRWGLVPHNITPAMVKDCPRFRDCIPEIRKIIERADYVAGFALDNDLKILKAENLPIPPEKKIIELKDWFWLLYGKDHGLDYSNGIGNQRVATELGIEVAEERLHSSEYDACVSLQSLLRLLPEARKDAPEGEDFDGMYSRITALFEKEKDLYDRRQSAGWCFILHEGDGFRFRINRDEPSDDPSMIAKIHVENRKQAMLDLGTMLYGKIREGSFAFPRLSEKKLKQFLSYSNSYSPEEKAIASKLMQLARKFK